MREAAGAERAPASGEGGEAVHAPLLRYFPEVVVECGGDPDSLLREAGVDPADLAHRNGQASYRQAAEVLERAAHRLGRPDFGLRLAARQCREGVEGPLGQVMRHSTYFGDVLELAVDHGYAHSLASSSWLRRPPVDRTVMFGHDILLEGLTATSQAMEQILLIGRLAAIRLTGGWVQARRILFRHQPVSAPAVYRRYFGCPVAFDQPVNATVYHEVDLSRPVVSADADAFSRMLSAVEGRFEDRQVPVGRQVRGMILTALASRPCGGDWVAHALGLHVRTLHRRLREEGTSFRRIKDEVRRDLAAYYLSRTDLSLTAISERLGFSEQAVFTRGCRRWFDRSPTGLRTRPASDEEV